MKELTAAEKMIQQCMDEYAEVVRKAEDNKERLKRDLFLWCRTALEECKDDKEELRLRAVNVYWGVIPQVPVDAIADWCGITRAELRRWRKVKIPGVCKECGGQFMVVAERRGENVTGTCETCIANVETQRKKHRKQWDAEKERLQLLRTMPYKEYLQTPEWQRTRLAALKRAKFACQLCNGDKPLQVHHRTYERRGDEWASDLIALCADCHGKFHDKIKEAGFEYQVHP